MGIAIFLRIAFSVCLLFSVTHRGDASSMFRADYNHSSKSVRSELMNTPGRGILLHSPEKISRPRSPAVALLVFFPASAEHPFPPVVQVCQRANKLQTAIIRIKKISPYDTERQTYQQNELHSFSSSYRIKKCGKSDRDYGRSDCRSASLGDTETNLPRCWVDNLNPNGSRDNLLDNDTLKHLRLWQRTQ